MWHLTVRKFDRKEICLSPVFLCQICLLFVIFCTTCQIRTCNYPVWENSFTMACNFSGSQGSFPSSDDRLLFLSQSLSKWILRFNKTANGVTVWNIHTLRKVKAQCPCDPKNCKQSEIARTLKIQGCCKDAHLLVLSTTTWTWTSWSP